jgi:DNA polymerase III sliding clamp (beta) subunit (PCNA family)
MKIIFDHVKLRQALKRVAPAVNSKCIIPVMENVHLNVEGNNCTLSTTDQEAYMQTTCECDSKENFEALLPFEELSRMVNVLSGPIHISFQEKKAIITCDADVFPLAIAQVKNVFPAAPAFEAVANFQLEQHHINTMQAMSIVTETDKSGVDTKFEHLCIVCAADKPVTIYSTDRFRAARLILSETASGVGTVPLHKTHLKFLKETGNCDFAFNDKYVRVQSLNLTVYLLLNEVKWPDASKLFSKHDSYNAELSRPDLDATIRKAQVYKTELPLLNLHFGTGNELVVEFGDDIHGRDAKSVVKVKQELQPVSYTLNCRFLGELLDCLPKDEQIDLDVAQDGKQIYLGNKTDGTVTCVIMPVTPISKN